MIKTPVIVPLLIVAAVCRPARAFEINRAALDELKRIDGYDRLFKMHPELFIHGPLDGIKLYLLEKEPAVLGASFNGFREDIFMRPCRQVAELYNKHKRYFDELPSTVIEFESWDDIDRNRLCRVFAVAKDCKLYTDASFITRTHVSMLAGFYFNNELKMVR